MYVKQSDTDRILRHCYFIELIIDIAVNNIKSEKLLTISPKSFKLKKIK